MSSISSIDSFQSINALLQNQNKNGVGAFGQGASPRSADFAAALQSLGVDPSKSSDIQSQIQQAVSQVQSTDSNLSGADRQNAFRTAIENVLKNNGVDPTKFRSALQAQHAKHAHGHHRKGGGLSSVSSNTNPASETPSVSNGQTLLDTTI